MSKISVSCIAQSRGQAEGIVDHLKAATFSQNCISVLYREADANHEIADEQTSKASADAVASAGTGGAQGRIANIGTRSLSIPGVGALFACGPIGGTMRNANPTVEFGGIVGGLIGIGIAESEANLYDVRISDGNILISVGTDNSNALNIAKSIFMSAGAVDISRTVEASNSNESAGDLPTLPAFFSYRAAV